MATRMIPKAEWGGFFDDFSRDHLGERATLEMLSPELGDQTIASRQVFRGISADEKDGENAISVMLGGTAEEGTTHAVASPVEVWIKEAEGDAGAVLDIRTDEGTSWLIRFAP